MVICQALVKTMVRLPGYDFLLNWRFKIIPGCNSKFLHATPPPLSYIPHCPPHIYTHTTACTPNGWIVCLFKKKSIFINSIGNSRILNKKIPEKKSPRYFSIIGHSWPIGRHICVLLIINVPPMSGYFVFPNNWFQQLNAPPMNKLSAFPNN